MLHGLLVVFLVFIPVRLLFQQLSLLRVGTAEVDQLIEGLSSGSRSCHGQRGE